MSNDGSGAPEHAVAFTNLFSARRFAWWRPINLLVVGGLVTAFTYTTIVFITVVGTSIVIPGTVLSGPGESALDVFLRCFMFASGILGGLAAIRVGMLLRPWFAVNVTGQARWRIQLIFVLIALAVTVVLIPVVMAASGKNVTVEAGGALILAYVVGTPLQCAGEEFVYRGFVQQAIGSWFSHRRLGFIISTVVTAAAFGLVHSPGNLTGLSTFAVVGAILSWLAWRTGGLEASIALHTSYSLVLNLVTGLRSHEVNAFPYFGSEAWSAVGMIIPMLAGALLLAAWASRSQVVNQRVWAEPEEA